MKWLVCVDWSGSTGRELSSLERPGESQCLSLCVAEAVVIL